MIRERSDPSAGVLHAAIVLLVVGAVGGMELSWLPPLAPPLLLLAGGALSVAVAARRWGPGAAPGYVRASHVLFVVVALVEAAGAARQVGWQRLALALSVAMVLACVWAVVETGRGGDRHSPAA